MILEGKEVPKEKLLHALRKGTIENKFSPIYCGIVARISTACRFCSTRL